MTKRVREILSYYDSENAGVRSNLARMLNHGKLAGHRQVRYPAGGPGLRAWSRAQLRRQSAGLRSALSFPARDRRRMQRLRGAARFPGGGCRRIRRRDSAHPETQQPRRPQRRERSRARGYRQRQGCAPARLRRRRTHDLSRLDRGEIDVPGSARNWRRSQITRPGAGDVVVSARLRSASRARPRSTWSPTRRKSRRNSAPTSSR